MASLAIYFCVYILRTILMVQSYGMAAGDCGSDYRDANS